MTCSFRSSGLKYALPLLLTAVALAGPAAAADPEAGPFTEESKLDKAQAGFYRLRIGKIDVTALSDGTGGFFVLNVLAKPKRAEAEELMAKSWVKQPVDTSINAFLIKLPDHTILVDTGTGDLLGPKLAKVLDSLRASGVKPEDVTDIPVTHIHPDHTGGLMIGGKMVFPNATVHVNQRELDFWTDKATGENYPEPTKGFYQQVEPTVGPYRHMKPDFERGPAVQRRQGAPSPHPLAPDRLSSAAPRGPQFFSRVMAKTRISPATMEAAPTKPSPAGELWAIVADPNTAPRAKPANMNEALSESTTDASLTPATPMSRACWAGKEDQAASPQTTIARRTGTRSAGGASR